MTAHEGPLSGNEEYDGHLGRHLLLVNSPLVHTAAEVL